MPLFHFQRGTQCRLREIAWSTRSRKHTLSSRLSCKEDMNSLNHRKDDSGVWLFIQYILDIIGNKNIL
jgi:hypothetical protein